MKEIFLTIPGKPIAKKTHRDSCKINWKTQEVKRWRRFPQSEEAKDISIEMKSQYDGPLLDEGVFIIFEFYMPIPKRWNLKFKEKAKRGTMHHLVKPDASNLAKFYEDCMSGVILHDDSRIVWATPIKLYSCKPRTEILIKPFDYEEYCLFQKTFGRRTESDPGEIAI